jgi:hypothetical protein
MQDAVILANHLYDIKPTSFENIKQALGDYKEDRFDAIKDQYPQSHMSAKLIYGHVSLLVQCLDTFPQRGKEILEFGRLTHTILLPPF